jgi:hypothetical protein
MTKNEFVIICNKYGIHPALALENEELVALLKAKKYNKVEAFIRGNF